MSDRKGMWENVGDSIHMCMLCGQPTTGSIGAAGIRWTKICQPCKDKEDAALNRNLTALASALKTVEEVISK